MKVTAVIAISFEVERFDAGDPSVVVVTDVVAEVAQAMRHRTTAGGVSVGAVTASIHDLNAMLLATVPVPV